jgi:GNAT superfamily N-acetyltransferase
LTVAADPQISLEPLAASDQGSFDDLFRIYTESISPREQKPRPMIAAMASRPDYQILLARRNDVVIGFSVLFRPAEESFCLLEYMAVDAGQRNGGVGAALFQYTVRIAGTPVLLEVDDATSPAPDLAIRQRRQRFYRRLGCRRVEGLSYQLPWPGLPAMDLMVHLPPSMSEISKSRLEHWLQVIYQQVYRRSPEDPLIARMMAAVADPVELA